MLSSVVLAGWAVLATSPATVEPAPVAPSESPGEAVPDSGSSASSDAYRPPRRSDRTVMDLTGHTGVVAGHEGPHRARAGTGPGLPGAVRPRQLARRSPVAAALLGGAVGLGCGHYYASAPRWGTAFLGVDGALWGGLVAAVWSLNQKVVRNDIRTGVSLARNQREQTDLEGRLLTASWVLGISLVISHALQAGTAYGAAQKTNRVLNSFAYIPIGNEAPPSRDLRH